MANKAGSSYILIGSKAKKFTVSPSSQSSQSAPRQVVATILPPNQPQLAEKPPVIKKILLKAVSRQSKGKDQPKTFTLSNIVPDQISCCKDFKSLIKEQLSGDITQDEFDLGYVQGNTAVSLRSKVDLDEIMEGLTKGQNITLWCDGLLVEQLSSRKMAVSADDEAEGSKEKKRKKKKDDTSREDKVEEILQKLKENHGSPMQYRIWAEMHAGGFHPSLEEAPTNSMFLRAGGATPQRRSTADIVSQTITQLTPQVLSTPTSTPTVSSSSPARMIDNRSKCYKQLSEIKNLNQAGILSDKEYSTEREAIMEVLKSIGNRK